MPGKEVVFTDHARQKMCERGVAEESVIQSIHIGEREPAQRGLWQYRLNLEFQRLWAGRYYGIQQVMPVVDEEASRVWGGDGVCVLLPGRTGTMRISYDPQADAIDIRLREGNFQCRTVRLSDDIALDFAEGEVLVAIEVLGAKALGVTPEQPEVILERLRGIVADVA